MLKHLCRLERFIMLNLCQCCQPNLILLHARFAHSLPMTLVSNRHSRFLPHKSTGPAHMRFAHPTGIPGPPLRGCPGFNLIPSTFPGIPAGCRHLTTMPYEKEHADPHGPGDARPTAMQIVADEGLEGKLGDRVVIITGASSGIGVENARALYANGAVVYMPVRNLKKGERVVQDIQGENKTETPARLELMQMDLNSLDSVRDFAKAFLRKESKLNLLITNAGIMACPESTTKDGFEAQFGTNHVAHFLLFELLRPLLLSSSTPQLNSRVVTLSSLGHRAAPVFFDDLDLKKQGYNEWVAYGQAKTANILMAVEIERKYGSDGLHANSVMPGGILTGLQIHVDVAIKAKWEEPEIKKFMKDAEQGAATTMWAAVGKEWEGKGGKYLENCSVSGEAPESSQMMDPGYRKWAMDPEGAQKLWEVSLELTKPWREAA